MSGRHSFRELIEDFSPERREKIEAMKQELLVEMPPKDLRQSDSTDTSG